MNIPNDDKSTNHTNTSVNDPLNILLNNVNHRYIPASPPPSYRSTGNPAITIEPSAPVAPTTSDFSVITHNPLYSVTSHVHNQRQMPNLPSPSCSNSVTPCQRTQSRLSQTPSTNQLPVYIYELPFTVRKGLCDLLDADGSWRQLGGQYMGLNETQLTLISHALYRGASPTNDLLIKWEQTNPKVRSLFRYLASMQHKRAMTLLRPYVDESLNSHYFSDTTETPFEGTNSWNYNCTSDTFDENTNAIFNRRGVTGGLSGLDGDRGINVNLNSWSLVGAVGGATLRSTRHDANATRGYNSNSNNNNNNGVSGSGARTSGTSDMCGLSVDTNVNDNEDTREKVKTSSNGRSVRELMKEASVGSSSISCLSGVEEELEVSYKELLMGTDGFSEERIIGSGGFGIVYLGGLKGTKVAVKRLKGGTGSHSSISQAITELKVLNRYRIDNILPLYGISLDGPEACLLYQYMPNGSLSDRLLCENNSPPLSWTQRAVIAEGVAKALNYLHSLKGKPLIHGDVKSANVLLDSLFEPKLGDFGLSRVMSQSDSSSSTHITVTSVHGTSVYLPPEYLRQKMLSPAVDVYSYGIVALEMATGKRAYDGNKLLIDLVQDEITADNISSLKDGKIESTSHSQWFQRLISLGVDCAHKNKKKRPSMNHVLSLFQQWKQNDHDVTNVNQSESSIAKIKTPLELQMWQKLVRACEDDKETVNTCVTDETDKNVSLDTRAIQSPRNSSTCDKESNEQLKDTQGEESKTNNLPDTDESIVIPLLTELGIRD